jgi:uncharacterized membrane protein
MNTEPTADPGLPLIPDHQAATGGLRRAWHDIRARILAGLMLVLPILITLWVIHWLYSTMEMVVIDPLARLVLWMLRGGRPDTALPAWFEAYVAPVIAICLALLLLYGLGFFARSRLHRVINWLLLRVPVVSNVYNGVQGVFQALDKQPRQARPQRVVLVAFPHPGMKVPAFVTSTCRDIDTRKVLLCVYVPTTPVPTSGYFLIVPEEEVTELNWSPEQALQAIISAGLTAPPEVRYFKTRPPAGSVVAAGQLQSDVPPSQRDGG